MTVNEPVSACMYCVAWAYFPRILTCLRAHTRHHKPPLRGGPPQAGEANTRGAPPPIRAKKRLKINVQHAFPHLPQEMAPQPPWPPSANLGHPKRSIQGGVPLLVGGDRLAVGRAKPVTVVASAQAAWW